VPVVDIQEVKADLEAIAREFADDTLPADVREKMKGWVAEIRDNHVRAAAARAVGDEEDLAAAVREIDFLQKAMKGEAAAAAVRGVAAGDAARQRLGVLALNLLVKGVLAALV
jgi:hypothetical protein